MIKPLNNNVLLKNDKNDDTLKKVNGIFLKESKEDEQDNISLVVELGDSVSDGNKKSLKKGYKVIYKQYSGSKFTFEDIEYVLISEEDILGVIEN
ncbi:co-chaperone GroES [Spiroplasma endosymbiont of Aspidapion aeneum]|uniref:co-chaperone GroES n=1 Tax=Spiroplasma endosymbiont of Aspidapion aeneum TaxID=3066276 RepID=UPI00313B786E